MNPLLKLNDKNNNNHTYSYIKDFVKKEDNLLDVGSGSCFLAERIKKEIGCSVSCIDIIDLNKTSIPLKIFDGINIPYKDNSFSLTTCCFVLHHALNQEELLFNIKRVSNNRIIIFEDTPKNIIDIIFGKFHGILSKIVYGSSKIRFRTKEDWIDLFEKNGLKVVKTINLDKKRQWFYPVSRTLFLLKK